MVASARHLAAAAIARRCWKSSGYRVSLGKTGMDEQSQNTGRIIRVRGVVQGVGFRPFVYRIALENCLAGHIGNDTGGVTIEVEGTPDGSSSDGSNRRDRSRAN